MEKYRHKAEVLLKVNGVQIQAEGKTGEVYSAIDQVVEKLEKQVVKYKEKLHDHRKGEKKTTETPEGGGAERGRIIKHKRFDMKPRVPKRLSTIWNSSTRTFLFLPMTEAATSMLSIAVMTAITG